MSKVCELGMALNIPKPITFVNCLGKLYYVI